MKASTVIQRHYGLSRKVTDQEVREEIDSLRRKGTAFMFDSEQRLATNLEVLAKVPAFPMGLDYLTRGK